MVHFYLLLLVLVVLGPASPAAEVQLVAPASAPADGGLTFRPHLATAGYYRLALRWPAPAAGEARAARVPVTIVYQGGHYTEHTRRVDQRHNGDVWVALGTYFLAAGEGNLVRLEPPVAGGPPLAPTTARFELSAACPAPTAPAEPLRTPRAEFAADDPALAPVETLVVRTDAGTADATPAFALRCGGEAFPLRGICGVEAIPAVAAAGANAVRSYSAAEPTITDAVLRQASAHGVKVLIGLAMAKPTGAFYRDPAKVAAQYTKLTAQIEQWKPYAAVLAWGLGNEIDPTTLPEAELRPIYAAIEQLARYVRDRDHYHPTVTVHAGSSPEKLRCVRTLAPSVDIVACNSYAHAGNVAANVRAAGWLGPYLLTEYAANQPMEQRPPEGVTPWGAPLEPLDPAKAARYAQIVRADLLPHPACLGGFAFKGAKGAFRITPTWFPLLYDAGDSFKPTPALDALSLAWGGCVDPARAAPLVTSITLEGRPPAAGVILTGARGEVAARVTVQAPAGAALSYHAELRPDVGLKANTPPPVLTHVRLTPDPHDPACLRFDRADLPPGDYRLFVTVRRLAPDAPGGYVSVGQANIPFRRQ